MIKCKSNSKREGAITYLYKICENNLMIDYNELYNEVKETLSEKRLKHSEGVVKRAVEYAQIYNVDINTVKLVAIAHDIAKELTDEEYQKAIEKYNISIDEIEQKSRNLLHSKVGACLCKEKFGFTDDMVNAVKYHTTGRENMSILEKIIYLADATDPNRTYLDMDYYVGIISKDINKGMVEVLRWVIGQLIERDEYIHLDTIKSYNYYKKIL